MDVLGDAWTPLILREVFYGVHRFEEFQSGLGIARNTLANRLRRMVDEGLLEKRLYQTDPPRHEYVLTEKGDDFFDVLMAISRWGDRWTAGDEGPPITFHHTTCGRDSTAEVVCAECGKPLRSANTLTRIGPGYPGGLKRRPDIRQRFGLDD